MKQILKFIFVVNHKKTCFKAGFSIYKIKNLNVQILHQHPVLHGLNI